MSARGHRTVADRLARFNRRVANPVVRRVAGRRWSPVALIEHRGRVSGRQYRTPVLAFAVDGGFVVSLPYGPERDWVRNVLSAGSCTLVTRGRRVRATGPMVLAGESGRAALPRLVATGLRLLRVKHVLRLVTTGQR